MNWERFKQILDLIEANPKSWDQGAWYPSMSDCGTACCFAGHAEYLATDRHSPVSSDTVAVATIYLGLDKPTYSSVFSGESRYLFAASRTLNDFRRMYREKSIFPLNQAGD